MPKSEKQKLHLERLVEMKRGEVSPLKGRKTKPFAKEHKIKLSLSHKRYFATHNVWNKGIDCSKYNFGRKKGESLSEKNKEGLRRAMLKKWDEKGRVNPKDKRDRSTSKYKNWRIAVFERDNFTCQECGKRGGYLEAHHIKDWKNYPKLRYKIGNGRTTCYKCHKLIDKHRH